MKHIVSYEAYVIGYGGGFPFTEGRVYDDDEERDSEKRTLLELYSKKAIAKLEQYERIYTVSNPKGESEVESGACGITPETAALCAMIEAMMIHDAAKEATVNRVSAASIGSVSVSYGNSSGVDISDKALEKELFRCASRYLDIYRGVG